MTKRFWSSLGITVLLLAGSLYATFVPQTMLPLNLLSDGQGHFVVAHSRNEAPLPPGWQTGDKIKMNSLSLRQWAAFGSNPPLGTTLKLDVSHNETHLHLPVSVIPLPKTGLLFFNFVLNAAMLWLFTALGLLLLWRGRRLAAAAVCLWCLANALPLIVETLSLSLASPVLVVLLLLSQIAANVIYNSGALLALYLLADDLTNSGIKPKTRTWTRWIFFTAFSLYTALNAATQSLTPFLGYTLPYWKVGILFHLIGFAVPLYLLFLCYRQTQASERIRIRWVWVSMLMFVTSYVLSVSAQFVDATWFFNETDWYIAEQLLTALTFAGLTYAVLRNRLIALRLMINRTLVYGVITALVVGIFAAVTSLVDRLAIGKTEGLLLQLLIPLSLGITLNLIKKRLDGFVERLFFQRQYNAEARLSRFAKECGFIESREVLLDRSVNEIAECLKPTGVALYARIEGGNYLLLRHAGERVFPEKVPPDDPALVSLRAQLIEADLNEVHSALGQAALVFPLAARGVLSGALVVGQRPAEHFTQKERGLLIQVSQQLAAALHALQSRDAEAFLRTLASGTLPPPQELRLHAQRLLQAGMEAT